jgi:hypothetical protein
MRSALTCLGIIIGIASVIAMMEVGKGSSDDVRRTISSIGANVIQIDPSDVVKAGVSSGSGGRVTLTPADCDARPASSPVEPKFFGSPLDAGSVIFVCDASGSMIFKLPRIKEELLQAVHHLPPSQKRRLVAWMVSRRLRWRTADGSFALWTTKAGQNVNDG